MDQSVVIDHFSHRIVIGGPMLVDVFSCIPWLDVLKVLLGSQAAQLADAPDRYARHSDAMGWIARNIEYLFLLNFGVALMLVQLDDARASDSADGR